MDPREEFRVYMKAASRGLEGGSALHISEDDLIAYQQDRLGDPERNRIQHHFTQCSSCFDRFRDVSDFFEPARLEEESPSEAMIAREWEAFRAQLRPLAVDPPRRFRHFLFAPRTLALAATLLLILTTAWGFWLLNQREQRAREFAGKQNVWDERLRELDEENRRLRELENEARQKEARVKELEKDNQELRSRANTYESQIAQLTQPELNTPIYDIYGSTQRSTGSEARNSVVIARKAKTVTLILNGADQPEHPSYAIEKVGKGRLGWKREGLKRDSLGNFVVTLNRASLGEGNVVLKIYGGSGKRSELIGQYSLSVRVQD